MKIGVISDTHRIERYIYKALDVFEREKVDLLFHLGDNVQDVQEIKKYFNKPVYSVKGNCDFNVDAPSERIEVIEGKRFLLTHGHNYNVKYTLNNFVYKAMEMKVDAAFFGHTHIADIFYEGGIWFVNPGSAGMPRSGSNSVGLVEIVSEKIKPSILPL